jgi:hypothetical protein
MDPVRFGGRLLVSVSLTRAAEAAEDAMTSTRVMMAFIVTLALAGAACAIPGLSGPVPSGEGAVVAAGTGDSLPAEWTDTPSPTIAPPTLTPTATPPVGLEWATPVAVEANFDGWMRLESNHAALWLPPGFEAIDMG